MKTYCVRDNATYEPLNLFPAPDMFAAAEIMRRDFPNKLVHCVSVDKYARPAIVAMLLEIVSNSATEAITNLPE